MNLQEQINKIQSMMGLSELYKPSGKKHRPGKFVYHKSPPQVRDNISKEGLLVSVGDCYKTYSENFSKEECVPAIFATDSENENYWYGVTHTTIDKTFGTFKNQALVEKSETARNLEKRV